jgi:hypothetical protein
MSFFQIHGTANPAEAMSKVLYRILHRRHFDRLHPRLLWITSRDLQGVSHQSKPQYIFRLIVYILPFVYISFFIDVYVIFSSNPFHIEIPLLCVYIH